MAYETILWRREGPVATLTMNRPEQRNGITPTMMDELYACSRRGGGGRDPCRCWC